MLCYLTNKKAERLKAMKIIYKNTNKTSQLPKEKLPLTDINCHNIQSALAQNLILEALCRDIRTISGEMQL